MEGEAIPAPVGELRAASEQLDLVADRIELVDGPLIVLRPGDPAALVDEAGFGEDEFLPYWAELWPATHRLVAALPAQLEGRRVLELGCGLGVPSLVAARRGAAVLATDWSADACALLRENARRNSLVLEVGRVDWRAPEALVARAPFDLVIAADVLYEARNVSPLLALVVTLESEVLLADPGRRHAADFLSAAAEHFRIGRACEGVHRLVPRRRAAASPRG